MTPMSFFLLIILFINYSNLFVFLLPNACIPYVM